MRKKRRSARRKKKNGIEYYFHKIEWEDIVGDSSIGSLEDFLKMKTAKITTYAFVLKKDKNYLYTFASWSDDGFFGDRNIIPIGVVKNIVKIAH